MGVTVIGGGTAATGGDQVGDLVQIPTNSLYHKVGDKEYLRRGSYLENDGTSYPEAISSGLVTAENLWRSNVTISTAVYTPYNQGYVVVSQYNTSTAQTYTSTSFNDVASSASSFPSGFEPRTIATPGTAGSTIVVGGGYYSATAAQQVYYSTDAGNSWTASNIPNNVKSWSVACNDAGTLWLAGYALTASEFYTSTNGQSYTASTPSVADDSVVLSITWSESGGYFVITTNTTNIYKTTNGTTLTDITPSSVTSMSQFAAVTSDGTIYVYLDINGIDTLLKSTNDGSSWTEVTPKNYMPYLDSSNLGRWNLDNMSVDGNRLTIGISLPATYIDDAPLLSGYEFLFTDDGGSTWETLNVDPFSYNETYQQSLVAFYGQSYKGANLFIPMGDTLTSTIYSFTLTKDPHNDTLIGVPTGPALYSRSQTYGTFAFTNGFGFVRIK